MDIISNVPVEISLEIFKYLRGEDLAKCAMVSRRWRELTYITELWKRCCLTEFPSETRDPSVWPTDFEGWKDLFCRLAGTWKNWKNNIFREVVIDGEHWVTDLGNGTIIAVLSQGGMLTVYDLNVSSEPIQTIQPYMGDDAANYWYEMRSSQNILVVHVFLPEESDGVYLCYEYIGGELEMWKVLRSSPEDVGLFDFCDYASCLQKVIDDTIIIHLEEELSGRTFIQIFSYETWSLETSWIFAWGVYEEGLYTAVNDRITCYNLKNGEVNFHINATTNPEAVSNLYFNEAMILLETRTSQDFCTVTFWSWNGHKRIRENLRLHCTEMLLHPKTPRMFLERWGPGGLSLLIMNLITGEVIWLSDEVPRVTPSPPLYSMVYDKFIFCARQSQHEACYLYDFESGRELFKFEEKEYPIKLANNKLIMMIGGRNKKILFKIYG